LSFVCWKIELRLESEDSAATEGTAMRFLTHGSATRISDLMRLAALVASLGFFLVLTSTVLTAFASVGSAVGLAVLTAVVGACAAATRNLTGAAMTAGLGWMCGAW
jgi:hypothetical protein